MKITYILDNDYIKNNCFNSINELDLDGKHEVLIREVKKDKTLKQLGGIFGCWIKYLSETQGESEEELHAYLKSKFLARIYAMDPQNDAQEQWVELLVMYQQSGELEKLEQHAGRISLSWSTLDQTKSYMNAVEQHYIALGMPLPVLDKHRKLFSTN